MDWDNGERLCEDVQATMDTKGRGTITTKYGGDLKTIARVLARDKHTRLLGNKILCVIDDALIVAHRERQQAKGGE